MSYLYTMFSLNDIGDMFSFLLVPFKLIVDLISTISDAVYGLLLIIGNILYVALSICALLPSPLFQTFMVYLYLYIAIYGFKIVKGII